MCATVAGLPSNGESIPSARLRPTSWKTAWTTCPRRRTWCSATISRPSPAQARLTAPFRPPSSAGCLCFCGCSSAASSSAPCMTSAPCSPRFAIRARRLRVVVAENIDNTAKKLFCIFAYLTLLLVVAAFASIVANTFAVFRPRRPRQPRPRQRADGHDLGHLHRCRRRLRLRHARPQHSRPREHCLCDHPDCHHGCHRIQLAAYGHRDLARL